MTVFDEIVFINDKIKKVNDKLEFLQMNIDSPRSSVISDMPRGGGIAGNPLEQYIEKKEELIEKLEALENRVNRKWNEANKLMDCASIDRQTRTMMYLRFMFGMQWKVVAQTMQRKYPQNKWCVNKCFRKYRDVLCKIRKL